MKIQTSLLAITLTLLASGCSQNHEPSSGSEQSQSTETAATSKVTQSIYAPYTEEAVKAKLHDMEMIVENGHVYLPAEVKEAESYINGWNEFPDVLKAMMETDLNPNNTQEVADIPLEDEQQATISARGRITAQESQSAFNVPGAMEYFIEIQSTNEQPFTLQGLKVNRGRCGFSTGDFYSKMPVTMNYSSTVRYLLKCRGDQVLEAEVITDQGNFNITF
ncbi:MULTISPECIES: hypothetical protein [Acinetobacter calcoaceticus/baumannii complex]|uniref:hypothetical protein n=1 Tax=Acinetobacter calcoaceticus/baumannii complex TaxID=909768 RepID=UPI0025A2896E|nr:MULTISPECIES: hypothetical protein [Acinetobacter calcoaceticus/baumannii complex]MDQ9835951.1 hypothetical protein [Acinetobacter baumannii]MEB3804824.1 hypothetical protein [Acinetobacter pittii]